MLHLLQKVDTKGLRVPYEDERDPAIFLCSFNPFKILETNKSKQKSPIFYFTIIFLYNQSTVFVF